MLKALSGNQSSDHRPESGSRAGGEGRQARRGGRHCKKERTKPPNIITPHVNLFSFLTSFLYSHCFLSLAFNSLLFLSCKMLFPEKQQIVLFCFAYLF